MHVFWVSTKWETNACIQFLHVKQNSNVCGVAVTSAVSMLLSWVYMIFTLDLHHCKNYQHQIHVPGEKLCFDTQFQGFQAMLWGLKQNCKSCQGTYSSESLLKREVRPGNQHLHPCHLLMTSNSFLWGFLPKGSTTHQWHHQLGTRSWCIGLWGTIKFQTIILHKKHNLLCILKDLLTVNCNREGLCCVLHGEINGGTLLIWNNVLYK